METFDWKSFTLADWEILGEVRNQFHRAIQSVSAVGRRFSPKSANDEYAALSWIPGLFRLAGNWITGDVTFRSSINFESFSVFLVDEKVTTLSEFRLKDNSHRQLMLWLEEQIGKLGLDASDLAMKLPYEVSVYQISNTVPFRMDHPEYAMELAKYFHNAYVSIREIKQELKVDGAIKVWPHHFDLAMDIVVKDSGDPETTSKIVLGMYPGDDHLNAPYFYVNTWPHVDIEKCQPLNSGLWISDDWTGAVLQMKEVMRGNQKEIVDKFYREAAAQLTELLAT